MIYFIFKDNTVYGCTEFEELIEDIAIANNLEDYSIGQTEFEDYTPNNNKYLLEGSEVIINPNYEAEQEQKERERIAKLFLTGADVERGIYQAKGMDFDDIVAMVEASQKPSLDGEGANGGWGDINIKALKIEFKANHFYRGNPYVNAVGTLLGFTSEQLDKFFETNDYTYLISEPVVDNSEEVETETVENTELEGDEV